MCKDPTSHNSLTPAFHLVGRGDGEHTSRLEMGRGAYAASDVSQGTMAIGLIPTRGRLCDQETGNLSGQGEYIEAELAQITQH